jgi:replicative DNA helicase
MNQMTDDHGLKIPPHSIAAERAVLGAVLIDQKSIYSADITPDAFYRGDHRTIFRAMLESDQGGNAPDIVAVAEILDRAGNLDDVGGLVYLDELANSTPSAANIGSYAKVVRDKAELRECIQAAYQLADAAFSGDPDALAKFMGRVLPQIHGDRQNTWAENLTEAVEYIDNAFRNDQPPGIQTGIKRFDEMLGGLHDQNLIIIAGRPSMGKSAVMCNIAVNAVVQSKKSVGIISLEMSRVELTHRMMSIAGSISVVKMRSGRMEDPDWTKVSIAVTALNGLPVHIHEGASMTIGEVYQVAMQMKYRDGIDLLLVDFLQLIDGEGNSRNEQVGQVSRKLKAIAKRLKIPVVAMAQINRGVESRPNKRPVKSDLRDSGEIEQDADVIAMLYRDGYYNDTAADDQLEVIIEKNRNGPTGTIYCGWVPELMMVANLR